MRLLKVSATSQGDETLFCAGWQDESSAITSKMHLQPPEGGFFSFFSPFLEASPRQTLINLTSQNPQAACCLHPPHLLFFSPPQGTERPASHAKSLRWETPAFSSPPWHAPGPWWHLAASPSLVVWAVLVGTVWLRRAVLDLPGATVIQVIICNQPLRHWEPVQLPAEFSFGEQSN